tara:strand:- start:1298 stop:1528 length:231 start_codon:yes stop_codon:yes gene_type:complete
MLSFILINKKIHYFFLVVVVFRVLLFFLGVGLVDSVIVSFVAVVVLSVSLVISADTFWTISCVVGVAVSVISDIAV